MFANTAAISCHLADGAVQYATKFGIRRSKVEVAAAEIETAFDDPAFEPECTHYTEVDEGGLS